MRKKVNFLNNEMSNLHQIHTNFLYWFINIIFLSKIKNSQEHIFLESRIFQLIHEF